MNSRTALAVLTALTVIVIGAGLEPLPAQPIDNADYEAIVQTDPSSVRAEATLLPTVIVRGHVAPAAGVALDGGSVMLDAAVERAGEVIAGGVDAGVRRMRLDIPFYTFGRSTRSSE